MWDKSDWPVGPWNAEPDKVQWLDEATGLPCLVVRGPVGSLCGYVGVVESHPYFGNDYDDAAVDVHGGLTFAGACSPGEGEHGICHVVEPGENDRVWWLGFDTGHWGDFSPRMGRDSGTYRDLAYVQDECRRLAAQLVEAK